MTDPPPSDRRDDEPHPEHSDPPPAAAHPIGVDDLSEWSFPASDPPAIWTWDPGHPPAA